MSDELKQPAIKPKEAVKPAQSATLGIGRTCLYYTHGNRSSEPKAAIVTKCGNGSALNLFVIDPLGRATIGVNVRHVDDPYHKTPGGTEMLAKGGAWDYLK